MKQKHIFGIGVIAIAIAMIISTVGDASQYVTFEEAYSMKENGDDSKVHVVGELTRNENNEVVGLEYDPAKDPNYLAFTMVDEAKKLHKVVCYNPPASMQDFEKSEKVVLIGRVHEGQFIASEILMKCPSKYEETEIKTSASL